MMNKNIPYILFDAHTENWGGIKMNIMRVDKTIHRDEKYYHGPHQEDFKGFDVENFVLCNINKNGTVSSFGIDDIVNEHIDELIHIAGYRRSPTVNQGPFIIGLDKLEAESQNYELYYMWFIVDDPEEWDDESYILLRDKRNRDEIFYEVTAIPSNYDDTVSVTTKIREESDGTIIVNFYYGIGEYAIIDMINVLNKQVIEERTDHAFYNDYEQEDIDNAIDDAEYSNGRLIIKLGDKTKEITYHGNSKRHGRS